MIRNDFPAAVAATLTEATGHTVSADHVRSLAHDMWDAARARATTEAAFRDALIVGTAALARALRQGRLGLGGYVDASGTMVDPQLQVVPDSDEIPY